MAREVIDVRVTQGPTVGAALLAVLFMIGLVVAYWQVAVSAIAVISAAILLWYFYRAWQQTVDTQVRNNQRLVERADTQHQQVLEGDPRGFYGETWTHGEEQRS